MLGTYSVPLPCTSPSIKNSPPPRNMQSCTTLYHYRIVLYDSKRSPHPPRSVRVRTPIPPFFLLFFGQPNNNSLVSLGVIVYDPTGGGRAGSALVLIIDYCCSKSPGRVVYNAACIASLRWRVSISHQNVFRLFTN